MLFLAAQLISPSLHLTQMEPCAKFNKIPPKGYNFFFADFRVCVCVCCACADGSLVTRDSLPTQSTTLEALLRGEGLDKRNSAKNDEESLLEIQVCLRSARSASPPGSPGWGSCHGSVPARENQSARQMCAEVLKRGFFAHVAAHKMSILIAVVSELAELFFSFSLC